MGVAKERCCCHHSRGHKATLRGGEGAAQREAESRRGQGRTDQHDEAVLLRRAALVPDHLLVGRARRGEAAVPTAQAGAQPAQVRLAATKAHAAAEASCEGGKARGVTSSRETARPRHA